MMLTRVRPFLFISIALILGMSACVPARQFEELKSKQEQCEETRSRLATEKQDLETERNELSAENETLQRSLEFLNADTARLGISLRKMTKQYDKINMLNDELLRKQAQLREGSAAENRKLAQELQKTQFDLQKKEDELNELERELKQRSANLDRLNSELISREAKVQELNSELVSREARVQELESIISRKDSAAQALKNKVAAALYSFRDKGLTVEQRNGKIYVSLEAKLLFPKGSTNIDPEGKKAILDLCKVIVEQKDISILVEGHTDNDPIKGGSMKDNWDLSVMRATSVVRLMVEKGAIEATKLTAAGRGEFIPLDTGDTEAAKAKNRRIEIILTPDLNDLFEILED